MLFRRDESFGLPIAFPWDLLLESWIWLRGTADWMKVENRSPISRAFRGGQGCGAEPGHTPVRHEYVLK